jgi:hypothetical protein
VTPRYFTVGTLRLKAYIREFPARLAYSPVLKSSRQSDLTKNK